MKPGDVANEFPENRWRAIGPCRAHAVAVPLHDVYEAVSGRQSMDSEDLSACEYW